MKRKINLTKKIKKVRIKFKKKIQIKIKRGCLASSRWGGEGLWPVWWANKTKEMKFYHSTLFTVFDSDDNMWEREEPFMRVWFCWWFLVFSGIPLSWLLENEVTGFWAGFSCVSGIISSWPSRHIREAGCVGSGKQSQISVQYLEV